MADLTEREYFHKFRSVKTLPLARLQAREDHVEAFKALAHLTRLQIFFFLVREGREVPAGEIQTELEVPGPTLSHHLDVLRRAGLVQSRREERFVYYSAQSDTASELVRLLTACCQRCAEGRRADRREEPGGRVGDAPRRGRRLGHEA